MYRVTVNAGHCPGVDPGAVGPSGLQEADVVLAIGERVADYLRAAGYDVLFLQEDSLSSICYQSNDFKADAFVSIHCNAAAASEAHGFEAWVCDPPSAGAARLAECLRQQIASTFPSLTDRGVKRGGLYVTRYTDCPAVLVETAFISNPSEEALLADEGVREEYARAIARGVSDYFTR